MNLQFLLKANSHCVCVQNSNIFQFIKSTLKCHARKNFYTYVSFQVILDSRYKLSDRGANGHVRPLRKHSIAASRNEIS